MQLEPSETCASEMHDIDMFVEEDQASDTELEKDRKIDFIEAAQRMGLLAEQSEKTNTRSVDENEVDDLRNLLIGLTMINTGNKLLASGTEKIREIVTRVPSLHKLSILLGSIQTADPQLLSLANAESKLPVTGGRSCPKYLKPRKVDGKFACRICPAIYGSWTGCDSHIRANHSHVKYGPCRKCLKFVTPNYDSFRGHEKICTGVNNDSLSPHVKDIKDEN